MLYRKISIALAAALALTALAAGPADAAKRHGKHHYKHHSRTAIVVHRVYRPYGFGTRARIQGPLGGPGVGFGYGYDRFDSDFNAYTGSAYGAARPWR